MNGRFSLKDLGQKICAAGALAYLERKQWRTRREGGWIVAEGPRDDAGRPITVYLPANEESSDFALRLEDLLATVAAIEERPAIEIAGEMARCGSSSGDKANASNAATKEMPATTTPIRKLRS